ncbi:MAG: aspartate carbamoyltransferase regulatory subunit [Candidatus Micrarchaeia archaeon]
MPLAVEKIENGTVIDHITAGKGLRVLDILGIRSGFEGRAALVMNVPSKKMGRKDIVKVEGKFLDEKDVDKIAVIAPQATLNIIRNGEVKEKRAVRLPSFISGVFRCPNPKCVTNFERMSSRFAVERGPMMRCSYCERAFSPDELVG